MSLLFYAGTFFLFAMGNRRKIPQKFARPDGASVVIPYYNEAKNLPKLIGFLKQQKCDFPVEFILVNDESTDDSAEIARAHSKSDNRFRHISSGCGSSACRLKKHALEVGIRNAKHEILLFTDADAEFAPHWLASMAGQVAGGADFVSGYVRTKSGEGVFEKFQQFDLFMMMTAARGAANMGWAWGSIGKNQAYRKSLFERAGGFDAIAHMLQGDDTIFLQYLRKKFHIRASFNAHRDSQVLSRLDWSAATYIRRRMRWAVDGRLVFRYNPLLFLAFFNVWLLNFLSLCALCYALFQPWLFIFLLPILILKFFFDQNLAMSGRRPFQQKLADMLAIWFILQLPFSALMGIASFRGHDIAWRGRKLFFGKR